MRRWALRLHAWLGIVSGLLLAISGLSGSLLVLRPTLEPRSVPAMRVEIDTKRASWDDIMRNARVAAGSDKVEHVFVARAPGLAHEVWTRKGERLIYVHPSTAQVLGTREPERDFWGWLLDLHMHLLAGETGHSVIGWGGVSLVLLGASGLILWWPLGNRRRASTWKRAFSMKWSGPARVKAFEWHRVVGFFASGLFLLTGASGVALVWPETASAAFVRMFGQSTTPKPKVKSRGEWRSLDSLVQTAQNQFPDGQLRRISFPAKPETPLTIRFRTPNELHRNGMNSVSLDAVSGEVLAVQDTQKASPDQRAMFLRYPLHIGDWAGLFSQILTFLAGLSLPVFWITGVWLWARKQQIQWRKKRPKTATQREVSVS